MQQQAQNYQRDELSLFLENAINPDSNIRRQTEYEINYICDRNFGQFLIELSKKISTEQEKKIVRQMSATIIKNMLNKEEYSSQKTTAALFYKVIESFKVRNGLYVDGILLIGSIGKYTKSYFEVVMKIISPYLIQGIESTDLSISKASILSLEDIIFGLGEKIDEYLKQFLPLIIKILSDDNIDVHLKIYSFNIISDLFTHSKKGVFEYFKDIFAIIKKTMKATEIDLPDDSDQDDINILIDLREHILENITCMFSALKGKEAQINDFALNACNIILYIEKITKNSLYNSQSVLVQSLCLIADFCNTYKDKFLPFLLKKDDVNNIIEKIEKNLIVKEEPKVLKELDWAKDVINKIICLRDENEGDKGVDEKDKNKNEKDIIKIEKNKNKIEEDKKAEKDPEFLYRLKLVKHNIAEIEKYYQD